MQSVMKVWLMPEGGVQGVLIAAEHPSRRFVRFRSCFAPVLLVLPPQIRLDLFPPPDWIKRAAGSANSPFFPCFLVVSAFCLICLVCLERKLFTLSFWNFNSWMAVVRQVRFTVAFLLDALALAFFPNSDLFFLVCFLSFLAIFAAFFFCLASFFCSFFAAFFAFFVSFFLGAFCLGFPLLFFLPPLLDLPPFLDFFFLICFLLFFLVFFPFLLGLFLGFLLVFPPFLPFVVFCLFLSSLFEPLATLLSTASATRI